ncbi:MarR family transcriptional regulator [bacterium]|nr:MarR family transcriptional regulator [bacterium]
MLQQVNEDLLLPRTELEILQTLNIEGRPLFAGEIAEELDCSWQLIGRRGKFLADRGLVIRSQTDEGRRQFEITEKASECYFKKEDEGLLGESPGDEAQ